jgi:hypothetical protein
MHSRGQYNEPDFIFNQYVYIHNLHVLFSLSGTVEFILYTNKGISISDSHLYVMILEDALSQKHR